MNTNTKTSGMARGVGMRRPIGKAWAEKTKESRKKSLARDSVYNKDESKNKEVVRQLSVIAQEIRQDWGDKVNYAAKPYLQAMANLRTMDEAFGLDTGRTMVMYFLGNAQTWRGETARRIKKELNKMLK